jgi:hypothetical protein
MTHSHPRLTRGGAEISAQSLFRQIKANGGRAWFLGCAAPGGESRLGAPLTQPFGADDYLYTPAVPFDYFKFANPDPQFPAALAELVGELRPDIVHAHHYTRFGVEMFSVIKRASPTTRVVVSLHEYLAICHNHELCRVFSAIFRARLLFAPALRSDILRGRRPLPRSQPVPGGSLHRLGGAGV